MMYKTMPEMQIKKQTVRMKEVLTNFNHFEIFMDDLYGVHIDETL